MRTSEPTFDERIRKSIGQISDSEFPLVIELSGMPHIGKSVFADALTDLFKRSGCRTALLSEDSLGSPFENKWNVEYTAWTIASFVKRFLEMAARNTQIIIADRGLFDSTVWLRIKRDRSICDDNVYSRLMNFAHTTIWWRHLHIVVALQGKDEMILQRSVERRLYSGESKVTTRDNLQSLHSAITNEADLCNQDRDLVKVLDFGNEDISNSLRLVAEEVVSSIEKLCS